MPRPPSDKDEARSTVGGIGVPGSKPIRVRDLHDVHMATWGGFRKPKTRPRQEEPAGGGGSQTRRREGGSKLKSTSVVVAFWCVFFGGAYLLARVAGGPAGVRAEEIRLIRCEVVDATAHYSGQLDVDRILERKPGYVEATTATVTVRFYGGTGEPIGEQTEWISDPFAGDAAPIVSAELSEVGDPGLLTCEATAGLT